MNKLFFCAAVLLAPCLYAGWGTPFVVYDDFSANAPISGIDDSGKGVVAYYWAEMQDSGAGAAEIINGAPVNPVGYPPIEGPVQSVNVAMNGIGNATLVWVEYNGTNDNTLVRSAHLLNGLWSPVTPLSNQLTDPTIEDVLTNTIPRITKDSSNNSIGIWNLFYELGEFSDYTVGYNLLQSGTWGSNTQLFSPVTDYIPSSYLAGSPSGKGLAIWSNSGPYILQGSYFDGSTWTNNLNISSDLLQNCVPAMDVSMNSDDQALIAWAKQSDGGVGAILFSGGTYGATENVYTPPANVTTEDISTALNPGGEGAVAFITYDSNTSQWSLYMAFRINNSWQTPLLIDTGFYLSNVNIGLDAKGNAYVVWQKTDGDSNSAIEGWTAAKGATVSPAYVLISTDNMISATSPSLAVNGNGQTLVSWQSGPFGSSVIEAAFGTFSAAPTPPLNLTGEQVKNKFASQTDKVNILTWTASLDPTVLNYYVFRNDVWIATVPANSLLAFVNHNQSSQPTQYKVTAVNADNIQSAPVTVTIQ